MPQVYDDADVQVAPNSYADEDVSVQPQTELEKSLALGRINLQRSGLTGSTPINPSAKGSDDFYTGFGNYLYSGAKASAKSVTSGLLSLGAKEQEMKAGVTRRVARLVGGGDLSGYPAADQDPGVQLLRGAALDITQQSKAEAPSPPTTIGGKIGETIGGVLPHMTPLAPLTMAAQGYQQGYQTAKDSGASENDAVMAGTAQGGVMGVVGGAGIITKTMVPALAPYLSRYPKLWTALTKEVTIGGKGPATKFVLNLAAGNAKTVSEFVAMGGANRGINEAANPKGGNPFLAMVDPTGIKSDIATGIAFHTVPAVVGAAGRRIMQPKAAKAPITTAPAVPEVVGADEAGVPLNFKPNGPDTMAGMPEKYQTGTVNDLTASGAPYKAGKGTKITPPSRPLGRNPKTGLPDTGPAGEINIPPGAAGGPEGYQGGHDLTGSIEAKGGPETSGIDTSNPFQDAVRVPINKRRAITFPDQDHADLHELGKALSDPDKYNGDLNINHAIETLQEKTGIPKAQLVGQAIEYFKQNDLRSKTKGETEAPPIFPEGVSNAVEKQASGSVGQLPGGDQSLGPEGSGRDEQGQQGPQTPRENTPVEEGQAGQGTMVEPRTVKFKTDQGTATVSLNHPDSIAEIDAATQKHDSEQAALNEERMTAAERAAGHRELGEDLAAAKHQAVINDYGREVGAIPKVEPEPNPLHKEGWYTLNFSQDKPNESVRARVLRQVSELAQVHPDLIKAAYAKLPGTEGGRVLSGDLLMGLLPENQKNPLDSHGYGGKQFEAVLKELLESKLDDLKPGDEVNLFLGAPGSGKSSMASVKAQEKGSGFVLESPTVGPSTVRSILNAGGRVVVNFAHADIPRLAERVLDRGHVERRVVTPDRIAEVIHKNIDHFRNMYNEFKDNKNVTFRFNDNSGEKGAEKIYEGGEAAQRMIETSPRGAESKTQNEVTQAYIEAVRKRIAEGLPVDPAITKKILDYTRNNNPQSPSEEGALQAHTEALDHAKRKVEEIQNAKNLADASNERPLRPSEPGVEPEGSAPPGQSPGRGGPAGGNPESSERIPGEAPKAVPEGHPDNEGPPEQKTEPLKPSGEIADNLGLQQLYEAGTKKAKESLGLPETATDGDIVRAVGERIGGIGKTIAETTRKIMYRVGGMTRDLAKAIAEHLHEAISGSRESQRGSFSMKETKDAVDEYIDPVKRILSNFETMNRTRESANAAAGFKSVKQGAALDQLQKAVKGFDVYPKEIHGIQGKKIADTPFSESTLAQGKPIEATFPSGIKYHIWADEKGKVSTIIRSDVINAVDAVEHGRKVEGPLGEALGAIRKINDELKTIIHGLGEDTDKAFEKYQLGAEDTTEPGWVDNYLGRYWKTPGQAGMARHTLEGVKSFFKERKLVYLKDGIKLGLEPRYPDLIEAQLHKINEHLTFIAGRKVFNEAVDSGAVIPIDKFVPEGFQKLHDPMFNVRGKAFMADPVTANLLNNMVSKGMMDNPNWGIRTASRGLNAFNQVMLTGRFGLSLAHGTFTGVVGIADAINNAVLTMAEGRSLDKRLVGNPIAIGREFGRQLRLPDIEQDPNWAPLVKAYQEAGGVLGHDPVLMPRWKENYLNAVKYGKTGKAVALAPFALMQVTSEPMMKHWVPNLKLWSAAMNMNRVMQDPNLVGDPIAMRKKLQEITKMNDNYYGQLRYHTLGINKLWKDAAALVIQSPGWNFGDIRATGEAGMDVLKLAQGATKGDMKGTEPMRLTMMLSYAVTSAVAGGLLQKALTGSFPNSMDPKDWFFPKTGNKLPNGKDERVFILGYAKDYYGLTDKVERHGTMKGVAEFAKGKISPAAAMGSEAVANRQWNGEKVTADPLGWLLRGAQPISISQMNQQIDQGGASPGKLAAAYAGVVRAPGYINNTHAENILSRTYDRFHKDYATAKEFQDAIDKRDAATALFNGNPSKLTERLKTGDASMKEFMDTMANSHTAGIDRMLKIADWQDMKDALPVATPEEKQKILAAMRGRTIRALGSMEKGQIAPNKIKSMVQDLNALNVDNEAIANSEKD